MLTTFADWTATGLSVLGHTLLANRSRRIAVTQSLTGAVIYTSCPLSPFALVPVSPIVIPVLCRQFIHGAVLLRV